MQWLLLALGGACGTLGRHSIALAMKAALPEAKLPYGTLAANAIGSFLLVLVFFWGEQKELFGVDARLVIGTGFLGGFTTYSSFNLESLKLLQESPLRGVMYIAITMFTCLAAGALAWKLAAPR